MRKKQYSSVRNQLVQRKHAIPAYDGYDSISWGSIYPIDQSTRICSCIWWGFALDQISEAIFLDYLKVGGKIDLFCEKF